MCSVLRLTQQLLLWKHGVSSGMLLRAACLLGFC